MRARYAKINPDRFNRSQIGIYLYLVPLAAFMALPILFIFNHAFKPTEELFDFPPKFFVRSPTLENFENLFQAGNSASIPIGRYVFNSVVATLAVTLLSVLLSTMSGYALSKFRFKGKESLFKINNLALMFIPVAVTIPRYLVIDFLGITDTYLAHVLPLIAMPVGLFLVKQFIDQVPSSLIEAAVIDGASDLRVYRKIILPMIRPAVATAAMLAFQSVWNNVETSSLFINDESLKTLAFYMGTLANGTNSVAGQGMAAAGTLIMFVPNLILFILMQKNVMNTMASSGLK